MAKLQYGLNEEMLKNMTIANKARIKVKVKITNVHKEAKKEDTFDYEPEM